MTGKSEGIERNAKVEAIPRIWVYAHAAPLGGDHTTALSGTLWRYTLRRLLARARIGTKSPLTGRKVYEPKGEEVRRFRRVEQVVLAH